MKSKILYLATLLVSCTAHAQDYTNTLNGIATEVHFYSDDIVRVIKYQTSDAQAKTDPKFVVTMTPQEVKPTILRGTRADTIRSNNLTVIYNKALGTLAFVRADGTSLIRERTRPTFTRRTSHTIDQYNVSQSFRLDTDEAIYGFGQVQDGHLNHRGTSYTHMVQDNMTVWMPYFHSVKGYGLYWDLYGPCDFRDTPAEGATFTTEAAHAIDYYVLAGSPTEGDDVVRKVRQLTGKATMVPLWTYGYAQSKERYKSAKETLGVLQRYRSLDVPIDCVVQDWQYWGGHNQWNAMEFLNPEFKNDYRSMIDGIHDGGANVLISIWANFGRDTKQFAHYKAHNQLMKQGDNIMSATWPNNEGVGIYNPYQQSARDYYWQCLNSGLVEKGIDAYWVDSSEPDHYQSGDDWEQTSDFIVLNKDDADNATLNPLSLSTEHTWRSVRNAFPLMHASGVYEGHRAQKSEATEARRVMIMTRSGFLGMQRYGAGTWSGDITSSWQTLANQIPASLNYSSCGIPSWNSDIGGFFNGEYQGAGDDAYNELYARWVQFGTFCTIMRSHGSGTDRAIYQFGNEGETYFDNIARYINLRYSLLPYIYSTARQVHADDYSFMRAMGMAYPADTQTHSLKDQFMFGRSILVAPVVSPQAESRKVYLPVGNAWTDIWTGQQYEGGTTVDRAVNLALMPLYVPAGTIMPWGPKVQYSAQSNWDNLEIRIYPGADGHFTLYEDERNNYNYEKGLYSEIPFRWDDATQTLTIDERRGSFDGMLTSRNFRIVLVDADKRLGLGIRQSAIFSKEVAYDGRRIEVKIDNDNLSTTTEQVAVERIEATPEASALYCGQARNLSVKALLKDGTSQFVTLDCLAESSDGEVATVRDGIIKAGNKTGHADITLRYTDGFNRQFTATVGVDVTTPTNIYSWSAADWYRNRVADRLGASDIRVDNKRNTITITKTGAQNIALRYNEKAYLEPGTKYFVVVATDVSATKTDSQLWYINGRWVNIVNPDNVQTLSDGRIVIAWKIDEIKAYTQTGETIFGLTSTNTNGRSTISYAGFTTDIARFVNQLKEEVAITPPSSTTSTISQIYAMNGTPRDTPTSGINIIKSQTMARKVYKK